MNIQLLYAEAILLKLFLTMEMAVYYNNDHSSDTSQNKGWLTRIYVWKNAELYVP